MTDSETPAAPAADSLARPRDGEETRWLEVPPDDPRVRAFSDAADEELIPRYGDYHAKREAAGKAPPAMAEDEVETVVIAEIAGTPAASGILRRLPDRLEMKRIFVRPQFRRRGLARSVMDRLERAARERGATEVYLQTGIKQPEAIALYESEGWQRIPAFAPYRDDGVSLCFRKELAR